MESMKAAASAVEIPSNDSMAVAGYLHPRYTSGQEGKIRASSIVIEANIKLCIISCDVIAIERDILDEVCQKIKANFGIPFENILVAATHTHHAPSTVALHGCSRDEIFCSHLKDSIQSAVYNATDKLKETKGTKMCFWLGEESTVGQNSRLLMSNGTIRWFGNMKEVLRPTGPFDPDLPVIAFTRRGGGMEALLFNHSTHNIGAREFNKRSPGFYGLASQELEEELGGTVIFLPGAAGSTHNLVIHTGSPRSISSAHGTLSTEEMILRIKKAVKKALSSCRPRTISSVRSVKQEIEYKVREFDEVEEDRMIFSYCSEKASDPEPIIELFRKMRQGLSAHQGEIRRTWLQVATIGDIALVGIPGELFGELGIQIKRYSPFRYTYVVELANDYIGYIPDEQAFDLGGYAIWTGFHSFVAKGTGEAIVEKAVRLLSELKDL